MGPMLHGVFFSFYRCSVTAASPGVPKYDAAVPSPPGGTPVRCAATVGTGWAMLNRGSASTDVACGNLYRTADVAALEV